MMEIAEGDNGWEVVVDSPYNRRIHHNTPMTFDGPAAGHDLLKTAADPTGMNSLGTMNNCGSGRTPWGTYLTCEENFNGYFGSTETARIKSHSMSASASSVTASAPTAGATTTTNGTRGSTRRRTPTSRTARLHRGDRPGEPRCDTGQAHGARPIQARERGLRDRR
jgi:secreted PhoX family phosphatase